MIYALVRGGVAAMTALLIQILLAATIFAPDFSSRLFLEGRSASTVPVFLIAFIEESTKLLSLRGIGSETFPFFRNSIFKGLLIGLGFALFEIGIKLLFLRGDEASLTLLFGSLSAALFHIFTGGLLGTAWFFRNAPFRQTIFFSLFFFAVVLHILYNVFLSPFFFSRMTTP